MFIISERKQRRLARILFLCGCLAPTVLVGVWGVYRHVASLQRQYEGDLSALLGARVQIQKVWYPRPGVTFLEGLSASDPVTGVELLTARQARCEEEAGVWKVELVEPHLRVTPQGSLAAQLARLLPVAAWHRSALQLHAQSGTIEFVASGRSGGEARGATAYTLLDWQFQPLDDQTLAVTARLPEQKQGPPLKLICRRTPAAPTDHAQPSPGSQASADAAVSASAGESLQAAATGSVGVELQLVTGDQRMPAGWLQPAWTQELGARAYFTGTLDWRQDEQGTTTELTGTVGGCQLEPWSRRWSQYPIWGEVDVRLDRCRLHAGVLQLAQGTLAVRQLAGSEAFVARLGEFWGAAPVAGKQAAGQPQRTRPTGGKDAAQPEPAGSESAGWELAFELRAGSVKLSVPDGEGRRPCRVVVRNRPGTQVELAGAVERRMTELVQIFLPERGDQLVITAPVVPFLRHLVFGSPEVPKESEKSTPIVNVRGAQSLK